MDSGFSCPCTVNKCGDAERMLSGGQWSIWDGPFSTARRLWPPPPLSAAVPLLQEDYPAHRIPPDYFSLGRALIHTKVGCKSKVGSMLMNCFMLFKAVLAHYSRMSSWLTAVPK